ncbi:MAG: PDZ domain-containing protein, partial [Flavobacteriales bacterium]|nr:PDZ domain-containing protein [Flavobacteriales bacterium]
IASDSLQSTTINFEKRTFHLWFQGICKPDFGKLKKDFEGFIKAQYKMMKDFPFKSYHFLFQILPTNFYHGVEHLESTVIALGPGYKVFNSDFYDELMGVSSHELFHSWNIKSIRPTEMMPYDYEKENYSPLGYVAEGVTTYYGDLFLYRSKFFDDSRYFKNLNTTLLRHFHNFGRKNKSLAESSLETWLDGYVRGIPDRKVSIYVEGSIFALIIDVHIRKHTDNKKSLDDVMRKLYTAFAKKGKGFSDTDYQSLVNKVSAKSADRLFKNYVWGKQSMQAELKKALNYLGLDFRSVPTTDILQLNFGLKVDDKLMITNIHPDSPAMESQLSLNDEIQAVNNIKLDSKERLINWSDYFGDDQIDLLVKRDGLLKSVKIQKSRKKFFQNYEVFKISSPSKAQVKAFEKWAHRKMDS